MSIRSPASSSTMFLMRLPRTPTQAPTQSTRWSLLETATLLRCPGLPGHAVDRDDPVGDLGDFLLEQPLE
jgi:hypothetical protein